MSQDTSTPPRGIEGTDRPDKWFLPKTSMMDQWICWGYLQMYGWLKVGVPLKSAQSHSAFYFLHNPVTTCSKWRVKPSLTKGNGGSPSLMKELADFLLVYHNPGGSLLLLLSYLDCWPRWSTATIATTSWPPTSMSHQEGTVLPHSSRLLTFFFSFGESLSFKDILDLSRRPPYISIGLLFRAIHS